jgi:hypothetical protein
MNEVTQQRPNPFEFMQPLGNGDRFLATLILAEINPWRSMLLASVSGPKPEEFFP